MLWTGSNNQWPSAGLNMLDKHCLYIDIDLVLNYRSCLASIRGDGNVG